jgi:hypothetical protein
MVEHYAAITVVAEKSWAADEFAHLLRSLCNLSNLCQPKNPSEQNQKDDNATTQKPDSVRGIPAFCRTRHIGNIHPRLPTDSHGKFSNDQNRRWR